MAVLGLAEFKAALLRVAREADVAGRDAVAKAAAIAEAGAKKNFEGAHRKGEAHVGGDKPNVVTGNLRRSIRTDPITRYALGDYGTIVAPRAKYGRRVELGYEGSTGAGPGHQTTKPYPYFVAPARRAAEAFPDLARTRWAEFLHG